MKRALIFAGILIVLLAVFVGMRLEPLYLGWLASKTETQTLSERQVMLADGVEIHMPDTDQPSVPTIVMFHGCAGPRMTFQRQWADVFNDAGYAAIIIDSTGPRGLSREDALEVVCGGKTLLGQERAGDVYAAIEIVRADPRLDVDRLLLAGWSHGAWTVMDYLTMDGAKHRPAGLSGKLPQAADLDGVVLFYPHCGAGALSRFRPWRQSPPTIAFVAGSDTIVEADKCIKLVDRKTRKGAPIDLTVYPDAQHVFDDPFLEPDWIHWYDEKDHLDAERRLRNFLNERKAP